MLRGKRRWSRRRSNKKKKHTQPSFAPKFPFHLFVGLCRRPIFSPLISLISQHLPYFVYRKIKWMFAEWGKIVPWYFQMVYMERLSFVFARSVRVACINIVYVNVCIFKPLIHLTRVLYSFSLNFDAGRERYIIPLFSSKCTNLYCWLGWRGWRWICYRPFYLVVRLFVETFRLHFNYSTLVHDL